MIKKLFLKNFRGIENHEMELSKLNILTGANNSGKSSVIYGLLALKNIVLNSNQSLDGFLNLGFLNLGGFSQTVFLKDESKKILLGIACEKNGYVSQYQVQFGKKGSTLELTTEKPFSIDLQIEMDFPYAANATTGSEIKTDHGIINVSWNGITSTVTQKEVSGDADAVRGLMQEISTSINNPIEELRTVDFIPLRRGFMKPNYSSVPLQPNLINDDEIATLLATDRDLEGKVANYLEKIVDRIFSVRPTIGTANFSLQSRDRATGFVCDLVNEGFGTNQLVTLLTKALRKDIRTICIEESEIHLHPELMNKLIKVFIEIAMEENKQFIITTHSEYIVSSLLTSIGNRNLSPSDLKLYYFRKEKKKTIIEDQKINEKGQVEGGLKSFYQTELADVKEFFNIKED
jgi:predicted ATPase